MLESDNGLPEEIVSGEQQYLVGRTNLILELHYTPEQVDNLSAQEYGDLVAVMAAKSNHLRNHSGN